MYNADGCTDGAVRLVEGETEWEGRLEVCFDRRWGTVGNDVWTEVNGQVMCNAMGYDYNFTGMTKGSLHIHNYLFRLSRFFILFFCIIHR